MQVVFSRKKIFGLLSSAVGMAFFRGNSEAALVRAAQSRDREAFEQLIKLHSETIRKFVARRVNVSDRDDVLQETWLAAWESLPGFDGNCKFRTWIYALCFHKIQDHWRRSNGGPATAPLIAAESKAAYVPREFSGIELSESLRGLWEACTPDQRELLRLYYSDGLTLLEISQVLDRNLNTLKYQFYRVHELASKQLPSDSEVLLGQRVTT